MFWMFVAPRFNWGWPCDSWKQPVWHLGNTSGRVSHNCHPCRWGHGSCGRPGLVWMQQSVVPAVAWFESKTKFRWYRCNSWATAKCRFTTASVRIFDLSAAWQTSQSCLCHGKAPASPHQSGLRRRGPRSRRFSALSMVTVQAATERYLVGTLKSSETEARCWRLGTFWYESQTDCHLNQDLLLGQWLHFVVQIVYAVYAKGNLQQIDATQCRSDSLAASLPPLTRGDALCPSGSSHTDSKCERSPNRASGFYHRDLYSLLAEWDMRRAGGGNPKLEDIYWIIEEYYRLKMYS